MTDGSGRRAWCVVACSMLPGVILFALIGWSFRQQNSVTVDEIAYLTAAKPIFQRGDFSQLAEYGTAPLPLLLEYGPAIWLRGDGVSDEAWVSSPGDPAAVDLARITTTWVVGVPLLVLMVGWTYRRTMSGWAAAWAGLMAAGCPMLMAHATLATTDACFTLFLLLATMALAKLAERPTPLRFGVAAIAVGLAIGSKYTGLILLPVGYLIGLVADHTADPNASRSRMLVRAGVVHPLRMGGVLVIAFGIVWGLTGFSISAKPMFTPNPDRPAASALARFLETYRLPTPLEGLVSQYDQTTRKERSAYFTRLHEVNYPAGHKLYYGYAFLYKSTPAEWGLVVALAASGVMGLVRRTSAGSISSTAVLAVLVLLTVVVSLSSKQLGLRYLLPVYPVLFVFASSRLVRIGRYRPLVVGVGVLTLAGQFASVWAAHPWHVSYIHPLFGGSSRAAELLGNGDVDWQHGWRELRRYLDEHDQTAVLAFTPRAADMQVYGIRVLEWRAYPTPPCRFLVMPAFTRSLNAKLVPRVNCLLPLKPTTILAGSIFVFDTADPAVWNAYNVSLSLPESGPQSTP